MIPEDLGVIVVTHGGLAEELVRATETILGGEQDRLRCFSIDWEDDVDEAREGLLGTLHEMDVPGGALLLTDMFGGTPTNLCLSLLKEERVEVVCGVNLPMVIKALSLRDARNLEDAARRVADKAREGVCVAAEILEPAP